MEVAKSIYNEFIMDDDEDDNAKTKITDKKDGGSRKHLHTMNLSWIMTRMIMSRTRRATNDSLT